MRVGHRPNTVMIVDEVPARYSPRRATARARTFPRSSRRPVGLGCNVSRRLRLCGSSLRFVFAVEGSVPAPAAPGGRRAPRHPVAPCVPRIQLRNPVRGPLRVDGYGKDDRQSGRSSSPGVASQRVSGSRPRVASQRVSGRARGVLRDQPSADAAADYWTRGAAALGAQDAVGIPRSCRTMSTLFVLHEGRRQGATLAQHETQQSPEPVLTAASRVAELRRREESNS